MLCSTDKELRKRQDMLSSLKSRAKQMAEIFNMSTSANRCVPHFGIHCRGDYSFIMKALQCFILLKFVQMHINDFLNNN
jgi:hypothetical protein